MQGHGKDATTEMVALHSYHKTMRCPHCGAPMRYQPNARGAPSNQHPNKTHEDSRAIKGVPVRSKDR